MGSDGEKLSLLVELPNCEIGQVSRLSQLQNMGPNLFCDNNRGCSWSS